MSERERERERVRVTNKERAIRNGVRTRESDEKERDKCATRTGRDGQGARHGKRTWKKRK